MSTYSPVHRVRSDYFVSLGVVTVSLLCVLLWYEWDVGGRSQYWRKFVMYLFMWLFVAFCMKTIVQEKKWRERKVLACVLRAGALKGFPRLF